MYLAQSQTSSETKPPVVINESELQHYNDLNFGVFQTVNEFNGRRVKANLTKINAWYVEIDYKGVAKEPISTFVDGLLIPSKIVDTKNGYHIYFNAHNCDLNIGDYDTIQLRLKEYYGGDGNARDVCRYLRVPGYYHCKDVNDRYLCKTVFESTAIYRKQLMLLYLPKSSRELVDEVKVVIKKATTSTDHFGDWISSQNQMQLLTYLNGSSLVRGDSFRFYRTSGGKFNTYTNGKPSAWFIDANGRIGSSVGGGPTIIQFVAWYLVNGDGLNSREAQRRAYLQLKEYFKG